MVSEKNVKKSKMVNKTKKSKTNICNKKKSFREKIDEIKNFIIKYRKILICLFWGLLDVCLIIYVAKSNSVNYVDINGNNVLVGDEKNLLFGRNYITLVVSLFTFIYFIIIDKFMLKIKEDKKYLLWLFIGILLVNMILFFIFTNRVY